ATFRGLRSSAPAILTPSSARLEKVSPEQATAFSAEIERKLEERILPGFDAVIELFNDEYVREAPKQVGLGNLPGGKEEYLRRIVAETGLELTPQQIHDLGQK